MSKQWYHIGNVQEVDSPAFVVYRERVQHNINLLLQQIPADRLRPHVKTHKSREVTEMILQGGITTFKCATISEAEMLAGADAPDVLLAYQPVPPKLQRFITLIQEYPATRFSCLVDNLAIVEQMSEQAIAARLQLAVYIDLNIGMNRSGIAPEE